MIMSALIYFVIIVSTLLVVKSFSYMLQVRNFFTISSKALKVLEKLVKALIYADQKYSII